MFALVMLRIFTGLWWPILGMPGLFLICKKQFGGPVCTLFERAALFIIEIFDLSLPDGIEV